MAKAAARARTSPIVKKKSIATAKVPKSARDTSRTPNTKAKQAPEPVAQQHLLTLTEEEGRRVIEARSMLQLLEEMTLCAEREITVSSGSLAVMMALIKRKLAFKSRLMPVDAASRLQDLQ